MKYLILSLLFLVACANERHSDPTPPPKVSVIYCSDGSLCDVVIPNDRK